MRNQLFVILLILFSSVSVKATETVKAILLELKDGSIVTYTLSEEPVLSIEDESIIISTSKVSSEYARSNVQEFRFEDVVNNLSSIKEGEIRILKMDENEIVISGIKCNDVCEMFELGGRRTLTNANSYNEITQINIGSLDKGVYVVKINGNKTFKFIKK